VLRDHLGGVGLGAWLLTELAPVGVDPLAAEAPLAFCFSPLVGTPLTTSAKFAVVAKSPLTGLLTDALASSHFAISGKLTGNDAIVVRGACRRPSVLLVDGDGARIEPADDVWGQSAAAAEAALKDRLGAGWRIAAIGPAGERGVRYATISHDGRHAGRGGLGAVMGAKLLKAVAVRAATKVAPADHAAVLAAARDLRARSLGTATQKYRELGTLANLLAFNALSTLPTRNFTAATFDEAPLLAAEDISDLRKVARNSCASCSIGCEHIYATKGGKKARVEYENVFALGPMCGGVRPRRRPRRQRPLRRARPGHHLGRRHDRLGDGVRGARAAGRTVAAVRRRRSAAAGARRDRRRHGHRAAAGPGVAPRRRESRARLGGLRPARQRHGDARLRATLHAHHGARPGGQRARCRPQPLRCLPGRPVR
jgi:aldehyde:ferredoxin oxidoreductase